MRRPPSRRRLLRAAGRLGWAAGAAALAGSLSGCGFQLRRAPSLPFQSIAFAGFSPAAPIAVGLRRQIESGTSTRVVESVAQAQVVLESLRDERGRGVVASTAAGEVREIQLRQRLRFRLVTPGGRELIPPTELLQMRDLSYDETAALAKEQEEAELFRAMQADIVAQVLRRLASAPAP